MRELHGVVAPAVRIALSAPCAAVALSPIKSALLLWIVVFLVVTVLHAMRSSLVDPLKVKPSVRCVC